MVTMTVSQTQTEQETKIKTNKYQRLYVLHTIVVLSYISLTLEINLRGLVVTG